MVTSEELLAKYKQRLERELAFEAQPTGYVTKEYKEFREELLPAKLGWYEKLAKFSGKILKVAPKGDKRDELDKALKTAHLHISPEESYSASLILPVVVLLFGAMMSMIVLNSLFLAAFAIFGGLALIMILQKLPFYLANNWRMRASNQMVLCIFYVVTYMRHTSNLERAIDFASEHLGPPLNMDMKRIIWEFGTGQYDSLQASLDAYLKTWKEHNREFVESFHLIESSLYETSEDRRLGLLDKSLEVMLEETYEKMLHYAQNLKSPITILHMLGIILPILGLVILPLVVSFIQSAEWWHIAAMYNFTLPVVVYFMGKNILSNRPSGYGSQDITELNPELKKYKKMVIKLGKSELRISPLVFALSIGGVLLFLGILPVLLHTINPDFDATLFSMSGYDFKLLDYHLSSATSGPKVGKIIGPFGFGASLLSLGIPLAFALSLAIFYRIRSKNILKIRKDTQKLENEFASALFQLGNRLGDGLPAEIAFQKVSGIVQGSVSARFFQLVTTNIRNLGMGLQEALFNPKVGAVAYFPSPLIHSSMKVLTESVRKGPLIAANAILNVSRYIKEMHKVNERLRDLMAEIISDMKSQISFLTPVIAGIVIGITSMIGTILGALSGNIKGMGELGEGMGGRLTEIAGIFGDGIPTYYFQIVVGTYVVQLVYILTVISTGIEHGSDKLQTEHNLGKNLMNSTLLYCVFALIVMIIFNMIAVTIITRSMAG